MRVRLIIRNNEIKMFGLLVTVALTCEVSKEPNRVDKMYLLPMHVNIELHIGKTNSVSEDFRFMFYSIS